MPVSKIKKEEQFDIVKTLKRFFFLKFFFMICFGFFFAYKVGERMEAETNRTIDFTDNTRYFYHLYK